MSEKRKYLGVPVPERKVAFFELSSCEGCQLQLLKVSQPVEKGKAGGNPGRKVSGSLRLQDPCSNVLGKPGVPGIGCRGIHGGKQVTYRI